MSCWVLLSSASTVYFWNESWFILLSVGSQDNGGRNFERTQKISDWMKNYPIGDFVTKACLWINSRKNSVWWMRSVNCPVIVSIYYLTNHSWEKCRRGKHSSNHYKGMYVRVCDIDRHNNNIRSVEIKKGDGNVNVHSLKHLYPLGLSITHNHNPKAPPNNMDRVSCLNDSAVTSTGQNPSGKRVKCVYNRPKRLS